MIDLVLGRALAAAWSRSAHVHEVVSDGTKSAGSTTKIFVAALAEHRGRFERLIGYAREATEAALEAEACPEESIATLRTMENLLREWEAKFAARAIGEDHPLYATCAACIDPFNDAVTALRTTLRESADAVAHRAADVGIVVKRCRCGAPYDATTWQTLHFVGIQNGDENERLELRDCAWCASTIAVELPPSR